MKNEILNIEERQFADIKSTINLNETFLVELDGNEIQNKLQLFDVMEKKYDLHTLDGTWGRNWDALDDLMDDLSWIPQQKHVLAIHTYSKMLSRDKKTKEIFGKFAKQNSVNIVAGSVMNLKNDKIYNSNFVFNPRGLLNTKKVAKPRT